MGGRRPTGQGAACGSCQDAQGRLFGICLTTQKVASNKNQRRVGHRVKLRRCPEPVHLSSDQDADAALPSGGSLLPGRASYVADLDTRACVRPEAAYQRRMWGRGGQMLTL